MMKTLLHFIILFLVPNLLAQDSIVKLEWSDLRIRKFYELTPENEDTLYNSKFTIPQLNFKNKKIKVKGFIVKHCDEENCFMLAKTKDVYGNCPPPLATIKLNFNQQKNVKNRRKHKVLGILKLNMNNNTFDYTLEVEKTKRIL